MKEIAIVTCTMAVLATVLVFVIWQAGVDTTRNSRFDCVQASLAQVHGELSQQEAYDMFATACANAGDPATGV